MFVLFFTANDREGKFPRVISADDFAKLDRKFLREATDAEKARFLFAFPAPPAPAPAPVA